MKSEPSSADPDPDPDPGAERDEASELVGAIVHEIGNHLGAIRLQADLLDESLDARGLAEASVTLDQLVARAAPLLALLRSIVSREQAESPSRTWGGIVEAVRTTLDDQGTRGVRVELDAPDPAARRVPEGGSWLVSWLLSLLEATIEHVGPGAAVRGRVEASGEGWRLVVEDDGDDEDLSSHAPRRGRVLVVQIARLLVPRIGGSVNASRVDGRTRVTLTGRVSRASNGRTGRS